MSVYWKNYRLNKINFDFEFWIFFALWLKKRRKWRCVYLVIMHAYRMSQVGCCLYHPLDGLLRQILTTYGDLYFIEKYCGKIFIGDKRNWKKLRQSPTYMQYMLHELYIIYICLYFNSHQHLNACRVIIPVKHHAGLASELAVNVSRTNIAL
jgi:hypothetical protein